MKNVKFRKLWDSLHSSYWFVPTLMVAIAIGLSFLAINLDETLDTDLIEAFGWTYAHDADGARIILSTIAGSSITVATTVFSITIVALQLASSQFGPRLLRNFMQDQGNQFVLGTFISTFMYCLLVLRTIQGQEEEQFLPQISVTFSVVLAALNLAVLIYFIHHAAEAIQADNVIDRVSQELHGEVERLFPQQLGHGKQEPELDYPVDFDRVAQPVKASSAGYIQVIDDQLLMKIAKQHNLLLRLLHRPGHFVVEQKDLVMVYPGEKVSKKLIKKINKAFIVGSQRTQQQDLEFSIEQLVEIAVRALSPGVNDPFTAIRCIDHLSAVLCRLAQKEIPSPYRYSEGDKLRLMANPTTFTGVVDTAFNLIRQNSTSDVAVTVRLLGAIAVIAPYTERREDRSALKRQSQMIWHGSSQSEEGDRMAVEQQYLTVKKVL